MIGVYNIIAQFRAKKYSAKGDSRLQRQEVFSQWLVSQGFRGMAVKKKIPLSNLERDFLFFLIPLSLDFFG